MPEEVLGFEREDSAMSRKRYYDGLKYAEPRPDDPHRYSPALVVLQVLGAVAYAVYMAGQGAFERLFEKKKKPAAQ